MEVHISLPDTDFASFRYIPKSGISGSYRSSIFNFLRNLQSVFHNSGTKLHSHQQCTRVPFLPHSCQHLLFLTYISFDNSHSNRYEVISHHSFDLHFPDNYWRWAPFYLSVGHLYIFFGKISIHVLCPFLNQIICFLPIELQEFLIYFRYQPLIRYMICKYFLPFCRLSSHFLYCFLCCTEAFWFDVVPVVYFCFCCLRFWMI